MPDHSLSQLQSFTAKVGNITLRFAMLDEPRTPLWLALPDVLAMGRFPRALRERLQVEAFRDTSGEHRIVELAARKTPVVPIEAARELMMRAAEQNYCPPYLADVFEVVADYAWDELVNCNPFVSRQPLGTLAAEVRE